MREKIINGEYVDLETLLVSTHTEQSRAVVIDSSGNLNLKQKVRKKISDLNAWLDAILIYTSIYIKAHPNSANGLLKYIYNVKLGAARCAGFSWINYDQQFRLKRARNPSLSWGNVDMELCLLYISQGIAPPQETPISAGKCFLYNNKGRCGRPSCRYLHRCLKCGGTHSALFCTVNSAQNSQNEKGRFDEIFQGDICREKTIKGIDSDSMQSLHFQALGASRLMN